MSITAELADGTRLEFPDGTDPAIVQRTVKSVMSGGPQASQSFGSMLRDAPRQVGLFARYGVEGLGQLADVVTNPIRYGVNLAADAVGLPRAGKTSELASKAADAISLPTPRTANERVIGDATRALASGGGMIGAANKAAQVSQGTAQAVARALAANPGTQAAGAATAGLSGGSVREAGGSDVEQLVAALAGGVVGGSAVQAGGNVAAGAARKIGNMLTPKTQQVRAADQQIELILQRSGIDWGQVPERVRQTMRQEVADALNTGQPLNADALRRLLVFRETGTTPTVGMLRQDPSLITRERNLAKTGANSGDVALQRLPAIENQNMAALLSRLDEAGAANAPNAYGTGERVINALQQRQNEARARINALYEQARGTDGRSLPMAGGVFTQRANQLIDEAMVGGALPPGVAQTMNRIAKGEIPFTVDIAEQFKTQIGKLQRASNDGQARYALGLVRQALDETPVLGTERVNPGNLPAIPGQVPPSVSADATEALTAFADARRANAAWMRRIERNPALDAVVNGAEPDRFVQQFVIGNGATARDLRQLGSELGPGATQAIRQYLVRYLRDAATNSTDDVTKFSNDAYRRAMRNLGDEKLSAFFSNEEIRQLRNIGEAAKYMQAQPAGSAVNNSNSGALVLGRGLDVLDSIANYIPLGGRDIIKGTIQGAQQTQVLRAPNALIDPRQSQSASPNALLPALVATPVQGREDDRRQRRP